MRVLIVAPVPFFVDRGTPMRILEEALALERKGYNVEIVAYHFGREIFKLAKGTKIKVRRIPRLLFWYKKEIAGPSWFKIILDVLLIGKIIQIIFKFKPEIIHAHLHEGLLAGWLARQIFFWRKIKVIGDLHGSLTQEMLSHGYIKNIFLQKIFIGLENKIVKLGNWIIVSSIELKKIVEKKRNSKKITVVWDGVNLENYKISKRQKNNTGNKKTIIYSGAFVSNKGINIFGIWNIFGIALHVNIKALYIR